MVQVKDKTFKPFISEAQIQERIAELAAQLDKEYKGRTPVIMPVLNGAFLFASDLFKRLNMDCEISFIRLASYKGTGSTGTVKEVLGIFDPLEGRDVIIVEDIIDSGKTLKEFLPAIKQQNPASIKVMTLLFKPDALQHEVPRDYIGFTIENKFVVGYGLDLDGLGRNLRDIYQLA